MITELFLYIIFVSPYNYLFVTTSILGWVLLIYLRVKISSKYLRKSPIHKENRGELSQRQKIAISIGAMPILVPVVALLISLMINRSLVYFEISILKSFGYVVFSALLIAPLYLTLGLLIAGVYHKKYVDNKYDFIVLVYYPVWKDLDGKNKIHSELFT